MTEPVMPGGPQRPASEPGGPQSGADPTMPLPPASPGGPSYAPPPGSPSAQSVPPAPPAPPSGPPAVPSYGQAASTPPRPPKGPGLFRQATSTTGGLIALIVAGCLALLLVLGLLGVGLFVGTRMLGFHQQVRVAQAGAPFGRQLAPGQRKRMMGVQPGPGMGGNGNRRGLGSLVGPGTGLGDVQHGDFTVQGANGTPVAMTLQRGTVTAASSTSVTVKSSDGFTATYAVGSNTRGRTTNLAKGDTVLVIAQKAGAKAVLIRAAVAP